MVHDPSPPRPGKLARPWGYFMCSLIGFKRALFRNVFQRVLWALLSLVNTKFRLDNRAVIVSSLDWMPVGFQLSRV